MRKSWRHIKACKFESWEDVPFSWDNFNYLQWIPNYQAFVNKKKRMKKKLKKKVCFILFLFFFTSLTASYVSHHHRDSFICLYLDLLEGKFWLAVRTWPRKQTSSNDPAICCSMCQVNVKVKVEMASVKGLAQLSGVFPTPQSPPPKSM